MADKTSLPPHITDLLGKLRWRIRAYVWLEGFAVATIWLALTFWVTMLVDFVVLVRWLGISELSFSARAILLVSIGAILGWILFRFILRRTFVRLSDRNVALLLERRFEFRDSLVTAVEMNENPDHAVEFSADMLSQTSSEAVSHTSDVRVGDVLNWRRLVMMVVMAVVLLIPAGLLFAVSPSTVNTLIARIYGLQDVYWPRKSEIEIVGLEMQRSQSLARAGDTSSAMLRFEDKRIKVARGANLNLWIRANAKEKEVPEYCTIFYRTMAENTRGRRNMKKIGGKDSGFQRFAFSDKPLSGILDSVEFHVKGRDYWIRDFRIDVVDNPTISEILLDYEAPAYTGRTPVVGDEYRRGMPLPRGTRVKIHFHANKDLRQAVLYDPQTQKQMSIVLTTVKGATRDVPVQLSMTTDVAEQGRPAVIDLGDYELVDPVTDIPLSLAIQDDQLMVALNDSPMSPIKPGMEVTVKSSNGDERTATIAPAPADQAAFDYVIPRLEGDTLLEISLFDVDGVITEQPYKLTLAATPDEPPEVRSELRGIGALITPDAIIPVRGNITDDWGIDTARLEVVVDQSAPHKQPFQLLAEGKIETAFDFRLARQNGQFELKPSNKLVLNVIAEDKCDLDGAPNRGEGAPFEIEVVTPDDLLRGLERRELSLRQNYEKIVGEVQELRDSLARIEEGLRLGDDSKTSGGEEPGEKKISAEELAKRARGFRLRLVQGSITTSETAARETLGISDSFLAIVEELVNNRVNAADREKRLKEEIADPLKEIANNEFSVLDEYLKDLEKQLGTEISKTTAKNALAKADSILARMEGVLEKMLELEDFNDLLKIVRDLIESQGELIRNTEKVQKKDLIDLLK